MYLYLGQETVINLADVVGIFDLENTSMSRLTKSYLASAQENGWIVEVTKDLPKSFVVCENQGKHTVYLSQISLATLKKRSGFLKELSL